MMKANGMSSKTNQVLVLLQDYIVIESEQRTSSEAKAGWIRGITNNGSGCLNI